MDLDEIITRKQTELARVQRELEALILARRLMKEATTTQAADTGSKKSSQPEMIEITLREYGRPMHVKEIAKVVSKKAGKKLKPDYLSSVIYRYLKLGKRFRKVAGAPNTFALLDAPITPAEQQSLLTNGASTRN